MQQGLDILNLNKVALIDLVNRLNELSKQIPEDKVNLSKEEEEYNAIVYELWCRIPPLVNDPNVQPINKSILGEEKVYVKK